MPIQRSGPMASERDVALEHQLPDLAIETLRVSVPAPEIIGLLRPFSARARVVLVALLRGSTIKMAAAQAGIIDATVRLWGSEHPEFREAVLQAQQWGFATVYEAELYDRALDREDRASGRLLEVLLKSRDSAYRDKSQVQLEVIRHAEESTREWIGGWKGESGPRDVN